MFFTISVKKKKKKGWFQYDEISEKHCVYLKRSNASIKRFSE